MNKDVIYIDVDDDVTAIIGKIKNAKEKIVALVPPKRAGVLQSAVNLRLLQRMATTSKKQLVLVTHSPSLMSLAAASKIPVAKTLQSKPQILAVDEDAADDNDTVIDGSSLPVGEHAKAIPVRDGTKEQARSEAIASLNLADDPVIADAAPDVAKKGRIKIPSFDSFRKKLFIGIAAGVGLTALLIWMFVFAPAATVIVTARTTSAPLSAAVTLAVDGETNASESIIAATIQEIERDETIEFTATGKGLVGERATGTMTIYNCDSIAFTLPANSAFTASGLTFRSTEAVAVPAVSGSAFACANSPERPSAGTVTVAVRANDVGAQYNISAQPYIVQGTSGVYASGTAMTGGSSKEVRVVSREDIERARGALIGRSTDEAREELLNSFTADQKAIESSFAVKRDNATSSPAVDEEVPEAGQATLTIKTTYTMFGVSDADLESFLQQTLSQQLVAETQRVYDTGLESAVLSNFQTADERTTASLIATGRIGPIIEEDQVKQLVMGKRFGAVQDALTAIQGVQDVDVRFSYFWVTSVPNDENRVDIEFSVQDE